MSVAKGSWCIADADVFVTDDGDTLAGVAARACQDGQRKVTTRQMALWHADRVDLGSKLLPASTRFKLGTRLRTNGQSGPGCSDT